MANNKSASLEARIKNAKDLVIAVSGFADYKPTSAELDPVNYRTYIEETETALTQLKTNYGLFVTAKKNTKDIFKLMIKRVKGVRSEVGEIKGKDSDEFNQVNSIVKSITGENISIHSKKSIKAKSSLKEGEEPPATVSVSRLDRKTQLGNFRQLIGLLRSYSFYLPRDEKYGIAALEEMKDTLTLALEDMAAADVELVKSRSLIAKTFNEKNGLRDRASRAKLNVRRQYGSKSPEYKKLVNKIY